jgi:hypothetical protein
MNRLGIFVCTIVAGFAVPSLAQARNCVTHIHGHVNQTSDGYMELKRNKRCVIQTTFVGGANDAKIVIPPRFGKASTNNRNGIVYEPKRDFIGRDFFTYSRTATNKRGETGTMTVQMTVNVSD